MFIFSNFYNIFAIEISFNSFIFFFKKKAVKRVNNFMISLTGNRGDWGGKMNCTRTPQVVGTQEHLLNVQT